MKKSTRIVLLIVMMSLMSLSGCMGSTPEQVETAPMQSPQTPEPQPSPTPVPTETPPPAARSQTPLRPMRPEGERAAEGGRMSQPAFEPEGTEETVFYYAPEEVTIRRYPTMETQETVAVGNEFSVLVSLTEELITPEVTISQGTETESGQLEMTLDDMEEWELDVVLSAAGFTFRHNQDTASIMLPRQGDSTPARFYLTPDPISQAKQTRKIYATFWYQGKYLAKILREMTVVQSSEEAISTEQDTPSQRTVKQAANTTTISSSGVFSAPDLTVYIYTLTGVVPNAPETALITIHSPEWLQPATDTFPVNTEVTAWLSSQYSGFRDASRGLTLQPDTSSQSREAGQPPPAAQKMKNIFHLKGAGRELYQKFAPPAFKKAFWALKDKLGEQFDSIQIFTNDPLLPWELMRPVRDDGTDEQDFLGVDFRIARWHVSQSATQADSPPQQLHVEEFIAIAPRYEGEMVLENAQKEIVTLQEQGFQMIPGTFENLFKLFGSRELDESLIHFAGHGTVRKGREGMMEYSIQLEDGPLDLMTARGLFSGSMQAHPFFFLNACDIGQAHHVANFVEGWAPAVLESGASGYIGGLWPLGDRGAADFATRFYRMFDQQLQQGPVPIAEILQETRKHFYENGDPTFLAYVYYGYPDFQFIRGE